MGKSAATIRFVRNEFIAKYDPTVEDTYRKTVDLNGSVSTVELVDTAGTEQFGGMRDLYYKNADGVVMVCAVNAAPSVKELSNIRNQVIDIKGDSQVPMVILLNKIDVEKESWVINPKELERQAKDGAFRSSKSVPRRTKTSQRPSIILSHCAVRASLLLVPPRPTNTKAVVRSCKDQLPCVPCI